MKKFVILLFLFISACSDVFDVLPKYEPFHMELLAFLYTSTQELEMHCNEKKSERISDILLSMRKNSVYLKNHMIGLGIVGVHDYSINIWNAIKGIHEVYLYQGYLSVYFCNEQAANIRSIIKGGMAIERLRRNR